MTQTAPHPPLSVTTFQSANPCRLKFRSRIIFQAEVLVAESEKPLCLPLTGHYRAASINRNAPA